MNINWDIFWNALSSIATIAAIITAFVIVKYDNRLNNRKDIKMSWRDTYNATIEIKFTNVGNRKIIIDDWDVFMGKHRLRIGGHWSSGTELPCTLEVEEAAVFKEDASSFANSANTWLDYNHITPNDEIIVKITDTAGKEYVRSTNKKFSDYLDLADK